MINPYAAPVADHFAEDMEFVAATTTQIRGAIAIDWFLMTMWFVATTLPPLSTIIPFFDPSKVGWTNEHVDLLTGIELAVINLGLILFATQAALAIRNGRSVGATLCRIRQQKLNGGRGAFWRATTVRIIFPLCCWIVGVVLFGAETLLLGTIAALVATALAVATTLSPTLRRWADRLAGTRFVYAR